jgi:hypothetical protein
MKQKHVSILTIAAVAFTLVLPQFAQARTMDDSKAELADIPSTMAPHDKAQLMVPAQAALNRSFDARKMQPGQQIRVTLSKTVQLKDGLELPRGTELVGTVVADPANGNGTSRIVLRFTQAELKSGKIVPIVATIVGFYGPVSMDIYGHPVVAGNQAPNRWNSGVMEVDQIDSETGIELQSKIASENSGTLVSTKKNVIKLPAGSEFALAIAVQKNG